MTASTCIYYDVEEVSADDVRRVRGLAPHAVTERMSAGTLWPAEVEGRPQVDLDERDPAYLDGLMLRMDPLIAAIERAWGEAGQLHGISLAEVARYPLMYNIAPWDRRWRHLVALLRDTRAEHVVWLTDQPKHRALQLLATAIPGVQIDLVAADSQHPRTARHSWRRVKSALVPPLQKLASRWKARWSERRWPRVAGDAMLFVEFHANNLNVAFPIGQSLGERGVNVVWLAGRSKVTVALETLGAAPLTLPDLMSYDAWRAGRLSRRRWQTLSAQLENLSDSQLSGTSDQGGKQYWLHILRTRLPHLLDEAAFWVAGFREAFVHLQPRMVATTIFVGEFGRAAAMVARSLGSESLYIQHGITPAHDAYGRFMTDHLLVWGQHDARPLEANGFDVQAIGSPNYAAATLCPVGEVVEAQRRQRNGEPLRVAFMASLPGSDVVSRSETELSVASLAEAARRVGASLTVKLHPSDRTGAIPRVLAAYPEHRLLDSGSPDEVIATHDVMVVHTSTTGMATCIADKPLIVLRMTDRPSFAPYAQYGAAVEICTVGRDPVEAIGEVLRRLRSDDGLIRSLAEGRRQLIDDMLAGGKGDAAERGADAIALWMRQAPVTAKVASS